MTDEPWSNPKPALVECPCGCGLVGRPRARAWQDGLGPHVKGCTCRRCVGGRQRPKATRRENRIAKDTGGQREPLSGALSGYDGRAGLDIWEETSNVAVVGRLFKWWDSKIVQSKVERMYRVNGVRHSFIASRDGKPSLVVQTYEDWASNKKEGL